jgi:hypothetical protein
MRMLAMISVMVILAVLLMWQSGSSSDANRGTAPMPGHSRDLVSEDVRFAVAEMVTLLPKVSIPLIYESTFISTP